MAVLTNFLTALAIGIGFSLLWLVVLVVAVMALRGNFRRNDFFEELMHFHKDSTKGEGDPK